jgi:hypothetical protein
MLEYLCIVYMGKVGDRLVADGFESNPQAA